MRVLVMCNAAMSASAASRAVASRGPRRQPPYQRSQLGRAPRAGACQASRSPSTVTVVAIMATVSSSARTRSADRAKALVRLSRGFSRSEPGRRVAGSAHCATLISM